MKIVTIVGARPQFVKAAMVSRAIKEYNTNNEDNIQEIVVHTGQHFDKNMSDIFFVQMNIPKPDFDLGINSLNHGAMTGQMMEKIESILLKECPDWVLVYGDTNSTIAGALAAKKLHIKVAHVEAGLRSFNLKMPEEVNRILTDRISDLLFCPTNTAIENLKNEGFTNFRAKIVRTGDIMLDAALVYKAHAVDPNIKIQGEFILATIHRAENTDFLPRMESIVDALNTIAQETIIILPLHPRTKNKLEKYKLALHENIKVIKPVGYLQMIWLLSKCRLVLTDSGGVQKEAYFFNKACITLRDETEWTELIDEGVNFLAGADSALIVDLYKKLISKNINFKSSLYGSGDTRFLILNELKQFDKAPQD